MEEARSDNGGVGVPESGRGVGVPLDPQVCLGCQVRRTVSRYSVGPNHSWGLYTCVRSAKKGRWE